MSEWKILKNNVGGEERFQIYRLIRPNEPQHSGNMEFYDSNLYATRQEALSVIANLYMVAKANRSMKLSQDPSVLF